MLRILVILVALTLYGCANYLRPVSSPPLEKGPTNFCAPGETTNCRQWTAGDRVGGGVRGHSDTPEISQP